MSDEFVGGCAGATNTALGREEMCAASGAVRVIFQSLAKSPSWTCHQKSPLRMATVFLQTLIHKIVFLEPQQAVICPRMRVGKRRFVFQAHAVSALFVNVQIKRHMIFS